MISMSGEDGEVEKEILDVLRRAIEDLTSIQESLEPVRDQIIHDTREIYVLIRRGFKKAYRGEYDSLGGLIKDISVKTTKLMDILKEYDEDALFKIAYDPLREYVELILLYTLASKDTSLLHLVDGIDSRVVLDGFVDFAGEILRLVQQAISDSKCEEAKRLIDLFEEIYIEFYTSQLSNFVFKDHKRKSDRMRSLLERVKSDYLYGCGRR